MKYRTSLGFRTLLLGCVLAAFTPAEARDKTDIITLNNGDRFHGEIKSLEYGKLSVGTDAMGTVGVEWTKVAKIESTYGFDVETNSGGRFYGKLNQAEDTKKLVVSNVTGSTSLDPMNVTRISAIEDSFWERINGSLSFGYNFTKSSDVQVLSTHFDAAYRAMTVAMSLKVDISSTTTPEEGTQDRSKAAFNYQWLRPHKNFWMAVTSLERNEELGIEGRLQAGGGFGHYFHQSVTSEVAGLVGLVVNQEWVTGDEKSDQTIEGLIGGEWRIFKFDDPETSLTSSIALYPSISQSGRYRGNYDVSLRQEIIDDFFFELSLYYDYDSRPPGEDPVKDDYGITTSLGYSF